MKARKIHPTKKDEPLATEPAPCFYFDSCGQISSVCKNGKSLCRKCADRVSGVEYPLRVPLRPSLRGLDSWLLNRSVWSVSPLHRAERQGPRPVF